MNSGVGQGPPGQANNQPAGQPRPQAGPPMYRPEMMRNINFLTEDEKDKYEKGLSALWKTFDMCAPGSPEKMEAQRKIIDFGRMLASKVATRQQSLKQQQAQRAQQQSLQGQQTQGQQVSLGPQGAPQGFQGQRIQPGQQGQPQTLQRPIPQQAQAQHPQGVQPPRQAQAGPVGAAQPAPGGAVNTGTGAPSTPTIGNMPGNNNPPPAGATQQLKIPPQYLQLVQELNIAAPANVADKPKWVQELKQRYVRALMQVDASRQNLNKLNLHLKEREEKGHPLNEEEKKTVKDRKEALEKQFQDANLFVQQVKSQQMQANAQRAAQAPNAPANIAGAVGNQTRPQLPMGQNPAAAAKIQQPTGGAPLNNAMQNPTAAVNAAFEAAKNQQLAAGRVQGVNGGIAGQQGPQTHQPQVPTAPAQTQQAPISQPPQAQPTIPQQQQQQPQPPQPPIKIEPGTQSHPTPAPLNTAIASSMAGIPSAGTPTQNSALRVQTPQSATPTGANTRPLTHTAAVNLANQPRAGSNAGPINPNPGGTPASAQGVMGAVQQGHPHAHPTQQGTGAGTPGSTVHQKLPIPKHLPERAMQMPTPVAPVGGIGSGRPTYSGGSGVGGGVMNQPALPKTPAYSLEGEGERVLNKKKLDELVRQVCGGTAEGQEGNLLAPEVEESVLNLADAFMDNVIHQACRNAKERGSKVLEIRDIQLVLERTYNIRIPGYSSEELRTVRKVQPNAQWITKMSAVQAAKVMPGKGDL